MDTLTRRRFLLASGVTGAAALAGAAAATVGWDELSVATTGRPQAAGTPVLVVVTLYGGNDGLSTLVPYADSAYHDARPDLAFTADEVLKLDGELGLNPAMKGFASLWHDKRLAIVRGAGYPKPDLSHFRSMDIWQTASPSTPVTTGWLGRWLDVSGDDPLRALNIGAVLPPLAVGATSTAAALNLGRAEPLPAVLASALTDLGTPDPKDPPSLADVRKSYRSERTVAAAIDKAMSSATAGTAGTAGTGDAEDLGTQLDAVSRCIRSGVPTRAYSVSLNGFDTHADEKATQSGLLGALDSAVSGFLSGLEGDPHGNDVVVLVYSEFGRRVSANASEGTDHGTASAMFVAGRGVLGGFYGEQPSLTDLDDGNLKVTTDFRAVYGELLHKVLGTDPTRVLDTVPKELGLLN